MTAPFAFLDVEASGFHGYPVEVAWCASDLGAGRSWLIDPQDWPEWLEWDERTEAIHGLTVDHLCDHGLPPGRVAEALAADMTHFRAVLSDSVPHDHNWLVELYCLESTSPVPFALDDAVALLTAAELKARAGRIGHIEIDLAARRVRQQAGLVPHRALDDAIEMAVRFSLVQGMDETEAAARAAALIAREGRR